MNTEQTSKIIFTYKRNVEVLYYKCIGSPFLFFKMYLDTLCKIVFNIADKDILPIILRRAQSITIEAERIILSVI